MAATSEPRRRGTLAVLAALVLTLAMAPAAAAQDTVTKVATALQTDPVYVAPDADLASQVDARALRARIRSAKAGPTYIAVLSSSAVVGSPGRTLVALREAVGQKGTYALAVGDEFRTLSDFYDGAGQAGDEARSAHRNDLQAALIAFIDRTGRERDGSGGGTAFPSILALVVLIAVAAGGILLLTNRRRSRRDGRSEARTPDADEDFVRLGDGIRALELDVTLGDAGQREYDRAVAAYGRANDANRKGDTAATRQALDEGLQAIAAARERVAGR